MHEDVRRAGSGGGVDGEGGVEVGGVGGWDREADGGESHEEEGGDEHRGGGRCAVGKRSEMEWKCSTGLVRESGGGGGAFRSAARWGGEEK